MNDTALDTDPNLGDIDPPDDDDQDLTFDPDNKDYPWTTDPDEMLRSFIFQTVADADYQADSQIALMDAAYDWIKNRVVPEKQGKKAHLKPVKVNE